MIKKSVTFIVTGAACLRLAKGKTYMLRENINRTGRKLAASLLLLTLVAAMITPAFGVVFTNPASITINDATSIGTASPYSSNVTVSGMTGNITDIKVSLTNMNHTFPDDVDVLLVGPTGANLLLMSDTGGSDDCFNVNLTFDDAAAGTLPDATRWPSGSSFKPTNIGTGDTFPAPAPAPSANTTLAAAFGGTNPNGVWQLFMVDDLGADMGVLGNGWSMNITTTGTSATTFSNTTAIHGGDGARGRSTPYASTISVSGLTGTITNITVTLTNLSHLNPDDIDIILVGPTGKRLLLLSDAGGTTDAVSANLTFSDAAAGPVPDAGPMVTGSVKPTNFSTGDTMPDLSGPYPNSATAGSATLASVFNKTSPNGTWSLYITDDATTSNGTLAGGWSLDITAGGAGNTRFTSADFDGDGKSDDAVFRSSDSRWYRRDSSGTQNSSPLWGQANDKPVPADYDGDRKTDMAIYRPSIGQWIVFNSATSTVTFQSWGLSADIPVPADFDGNGSSNFTVWRPSDGRFYVLGGVSQKWGSNGDVPVIGNFFGDPGSSYAVVRSTGGQLIWYMFNGTIAKQMMWGLSTDKPVPADYDGDGETDLAVFRPSDGTWHIFRSGTDDYAGFQFGANGDIAVPGDYDGDSKDDLAVWRGAASGGWYVMNSGTPLSAAALRTDNYGDVGDMPIGAFYLPAQ